MKKSDLINKKFSFLLVLNKAGKRSGHTLYECLCDCGKRHIVKGISLTSGRTKSCGCKRGYFATLQNKLPESLASKRYWYSTYRYRAKRTGKPFELSFDKFIEITTSDCFYCGEKPSNSVRRDKNANGEFICNGIDRKNNSLGYTVENSVPCCAFCNVSKNIYSDVAFIEKAAKICTNKKKQ